MTNDYEEMLGIGKPFSPHDDQLDQLAAFMTKERERIPAGYVYLAQFVDHDITLAQRVDGKPNDPFGGSTSPSCLTNHRTPFLNLETLYGFEKSRHGEPSRRDLMENESETTLKLGDTVGSDRVKAVFHGRDLARYEGKPVAILVDGRNDENLAVAQTHVMFARFHNAVVRRVFDGNRKDPNVFAAARKIVIQHYQWIVLHDLLPKVLKSSVLADVVRNGNRFYFPDPKAPYIPLEFSVAAFRFGHSMIANNYNWNRLFNNDPFSDRLGTASLMDLQKFTGNGGMNNRLRLPSDWVINWKWFYDVGDLQGQKLNFAESIGTKLARFTMPTLDYDRESSLAARDLFRTRMHLLPTGQSVAKAIHGTGERVLDPGQIANVLPSRLKAAFSKETPLWFYLLAEAEIEEQGCTLGEVGSRIMAEVFVELLKLSEYSILRDEFLPRHDWSDALGRFGMRQMLAFVANGDDAELDPLGSVKG
jgi:hypothetical protein